MFIPPLTPFTPLTHMWPSLRSGGVEVLAGLLQRYALPVPLRDQRSCGSAAATSVLTSALRCVAVLLAATGTQVSGRSTHMVHAFPSEV